MHFQNCFDVGILLFTSQFTVLINYLCALDPTLRNTEHMIQQVVNFMITTEKCKSKDLRGGAFSIRLIVRLIPSKSTNHLTK